MQAQVSMFEPTEYIRPVHTAQKVAEVTLSYRSFSDPGELPKISSSLDSHAVLKPIFDSFTEHHEEMWAILLNRANRVLGTFNVGRGGVAGVVADPKLIFQAALLANASSVVLAHNHPSGSLIASQADIDLTKRVKEAGKMLEIPVLDHMILTRNKYYSFADEGLM